MRIVLSRKGFDSAAGGGPSPILPDGTLLSLPIPTSENKTKYGDLVYSGDSYGQIIKQLGLKPQYDTCHLDPDIRSGIRQKEIEDWKPAFGQSSNSQSILKNAGVGKDDIFLFFGWFRRTEYHNGKLRFVPRTEGGFYDHADLHIIYGYMQVDKVLEDRKDINEYRWHPHAQKDYDHPNNALYIPKMKLSFNKRKDGYGVLDYREDRVLTMKDHTRAVWNDYPFLRPKSLEAPKKKNCAKGKGIYYCGQFQELVFKETDGLMEWVKSILED